MRQLSISLENKSVLVTGASSGIGKTIAVESSKAGARLIVTGRDSERLQDTLTSLEGDGHIMLQYDISIEENIHRLIEECPSLDGVVLCAGINDKALLKSITPEKIHKVIDTNIISPVLTLKELIKQKKLNKGASIVVISSISSGYATISNTMYAASKGALESMVKVAALELAPRSIRVNTIRPGIIDTSIIKNYALESSLGEFIKDIPLGRIGKTEDIAYATIFLLSELTTWITGSTLTIDGGITLR